MTLAARHLAERLRPAISDERVLEAIASVPRERFVPPAQAAHAYDNTALPIGNGQTISQPIVVARMLQLLELQGTDRSLDIGTGSGYHAALLARLTARVYSVERHESLSESARSALGALGIDNVELYLGDGAAGLPGEAPFDAINIAAAIPGDVPEALVSQLATGGRLVAPVGTDEQYLVVLRWDGRRLSRRRCEAVRFVPLVRG
jgi:protein-L-isoaspartate(D-aspartate) O-methyltransferase